MNLIKSDNHSTSILAVIKKDAQAVPYWGGFCLGKDKSLNRSGSGGNGEIVLHHIRHILRANVVAGSIFGCHFSNDRQKLPCLHFLTLPIGSKKSKKTPSLRSGYFNPNTKA